MPRLSLRWKSRAKSSRMPHVNSSKLSARPTFTRGSHSEFLTWLCQDQCTHLTWKTRTKMSCSEWLSTNLNSRTLLKLAAVLATMRGNLYTTSNSGKRTTKTEKFSRNNSTTASQSYVRQQQAPTKSFLWRSCTSKLSAHTLMESSASASRPGSLWAWLCLRRVQRNAFSQT